MRRSTRDGVTAGLLAVALALLAWDLWTGRAASHAWVPLLRPGDAASAPAEVRALSAEVGETVTIEDLVRLVLAIEEGRAPGMEPLDEATRAELSRLLAEARRHRDELLTIEGELSAADTELRRHALALAEGLSPEQRTWIVENRDEISVGAIEDAYWQRAEDALGEP